ncbi:DUF6668 family protein [Vallicoccus soli]|uniref:Uncharacterized protein n=1 Tax=Vallicoccus soli TaxID=2339232 RepID=A0A3A3ZC92_9ACTN|nr:DUF6668 family protein [Vallicoccus soli]RJK92538.1 hypothetical protein D5H78_18860 [Vallicoccus soli]
MPVVLVARSHWTGLRAAQLAATDWASGQVSGVDLLGLAILADAPGKRPRALKDLVALVAGAVPRTWHLPWVETWRIAEGTSEAAAPKEVRRLLTDVRTLLTATPNALMAQDRKR